MKLKTQIVIKLKNSNCDETKLNQTVTKFKNKTQMVTKLKNSHSH